MLSLSAWLSPPAKGGYSTEAEAEASAFLDAIPAMGPSPRLPARSLTPAKGGHSASVRRGGLRVTVS